MGGQQEVKVKNNDRIAENLLSGCTWQVTKRDEKEKEKKSPDNHHCLQFHLLSVGGTPFISSII